MGFSGAGGAGSATAAVGASATRSSGLMSARGYHFRNPLETSATRSREERVALMKPFRLSPTVGALGAALFTSQCSGDRVPSGLRATPAGTGPTIVFDLTVRPLPDIPIPNDIATFADPTSRTGRRLNASLA